MNANEKYIDMKLRDFTEILGAKTTMPGGGSAAAYVASLSNSLASMVANFTIGKKKYIEHDPLMQEIILECKQISQRLLDLVDKDAEEYLKLSSAYSLPKNTEEEKRIADVEKERCLKLAAGVPMILLRECMALTDIHEKLSKYGSKMLQSDVAVGVLMLKSAAQSAKINIVINIKYIKDEDFKSSYYKELDTLSKNIEEKCDFIYENVYSELIK